MKKLLRSILFLVLLFALLFAAQALFPALFGGGSPVPAVTAVPAAQPSAPPDATAPPALTAAPSPDGGAETAPPDASAEPSPAGIAPVGAAVEEDGEYDGKDELALYIHLYGHLPGNFVTKKEAEAAGWKGGSLDRVLPGKCIGGDYFGNREGMLPKAKGRKWTECDVNTRGRRSRGPERIVFSNDGLIYYSPDHYESFELLYDGS